MSDCIEWWGTRDHKNYGVLKRRGRMLKAHRMVWEECFGPIPDGMFILHSCDNPPCVNPEHLRPGTPQDNMDDKMARGRGVFPGAPRRDFCKHGHPLSGDNLVYYKWRGKQKRACRTCRRRIDAEHRQRKLEVVKVKGAK